MFPLYVDITLILTWILTCMPLPLEHALRADDPVRKMDAEMLPPSLLGEVTQVVILDLQRILVQASLRHRRVDVVVRTEPELEVAAHVVGDEDGDVDEAVAGSVRLRDHTVGEPPASLVLLSFGVPGVATYSAFPAICVPLALYKTNKNRLRNKSSCKISVMAIVMIF
jgi:hypothetical protein